MKTVVKLSFLLLFTLLSRFGYAHSDDHNNNTFYSTCKRPEPKQSSETTPMVGIAIDDGALDNDDVDDLICLEEDEQDDFNRTTFSSRYFIAFYYSFLQDGHYIFTGNRPFYKAFFFNASGKYITLRVLRI